MSLNVPAPPYIYRGGCIGISIHIGIHISMPGSMPVDVYISISIRYIFFWAFWALDSKWALIITLFVEYFCLLYLVLLLRR